MKTKLLLFSLLTSVMTWAQSVPSFHGDTNSTFTSLTAAAALDHSATGANQTWTFSGLTSAGNFVYTYVAPTAADLTTYPGTTEVTVATDANGSSNMYTKTVGSTFSITGVTGTDLDINFATDNATLGAFPMAFGYTNTDATVAGSYVYTTYSGTFSGTLTTTVDATGTLNLPDFNYTGTVVRLKTVLNINLNYSFFSNVGTATQTSYIYYDTANPFNNNPIFRSVTTAAVVPLLSINQSNTSLEKFTTNLATPKHDFAGLSIQNPVQNAVVIESSSVVEHAAITVTDVVGNTIYTTTNTTLQGTFSLPLSLTKGLYLITISNDQGSMTKKLLKN
jgi:hypothetical protein